MNDDEPTKEQVLAFLEREVDRLEGFFDYADKHAERGAFPPAGNDTRNRIRMLKAAAVYVAGGPRILPEQNPELVHLLERLGRMARPAEPPSSFDQFVAQWFAVPFIFRAVFGLTVLVLLLELVVSNF